MLLIGVPWDHQWVQKLLRGLVGNMVTSRQTFKVGKTLVSPLTPFFLLSHYG